MTQYSIYNETLHHLNPEAEAWSAAAFDAVEKHACVQALHISYIHSLSTAEKKDLISDSSLNLPENFFEEALAELSKQLDESEADTLAGIRVLAHNTSLLLAQGGDDRLTLRMDPPPSPDAAGGPGDPWSAKINKYNGSSFVRPGLTFRGSCTCSSVTPKGLAVARTTHQQMLQDVIGGVPIGQVLMEENDDIRRRLHAALHVSPDSAQIILFPSGSDAELIPSIAALVRSQTLHQRELEQQQQTQTETEAQTEKLLTTRQSKVFNFIAGAGEVGSGTAKASGGRYFSNTSNAPVDTTTADGAPLEGLTDGDIEVIEFKARSADGSVTLQQTKLCDTLREKLTGADSVPWSVGVLHVVIGTKTGLVYPSLELVRTLQEEFGERLLVVVDACQLRCRLSMMREYIDMGAFVLITGSKFFCGPPFSGAVLAPRHLTLELERNLTPSSVSSSGKQTGTAIPVGLQSFLTPYDVPKDMPLLRGFLTVPHQQLTPRRPWMNPGLTLRWACALDTITAFASLPAEAVASFSQKWVRDVQALISECHPYLRCLEEKGEDGGSNSAVMPGGICSIVSFVACAPDSDGKNVKCLHFDDMKQLWVQMISSGDQRTALGQPVLLSPDVTVLRIALGAQMVVEALTLDCPREREAVMEQIHAEDVLVVGKLKGLCAERWGRFEPPAASRI